MASSPWSTVRLVRYSDLRDSYSHQKVYGPTESYWVPRREVLIDVFGQAIDIPHVIDYIDGRDVYDLSIGTPKKITGWDYGSDPSYIKAMDELDKLISYTVTPWDEFYHKAENLDIRLIPADALCPPPETPESFWPHSLPVNFVTNCPWRTIPGIWSWDTSYIPFSGEGIQVNRR